MLQLSGGGRGLGNLSRIASPGLEGTNGVDFGNINDAAQSL